MHKIKVFVSSDLQDKRAFQLLKNDERVSLNGTSLLSITPLPYTIPNTHWDLIFFLSRNGVRIFAESLSILLQQNADIKLAAFGKGTAESIIELGLQPDFTGTGSAKSTIDAFGPLALNQSILLPCAKLSRDSIYTPLLDISKVTKLAIYDNQLNPEQMPGGSFDIYAFTSPMNVESFAKTRRFDQNAVFIGLDSATIHAMTEHGCENPILCAEPYLPAIERKILDHIELLLHI